ncbi:nucleoside-triphosphatase [Methanofollis sp. W23]|uniref:nucleoside-triphosphatase n=1 Tax=Methanofollis sp. W23 TaxID=2817849 RepID=UPI001AE63DF9|nr:nucleoside-triphosphatase [Methanofollis sp. W23]MBP2146839.1 nucleoside-triphosphatase [Methanofollis sp. W23]
MKNLLITGAPGSGKTTLVRRAVKGLPGITGFYTQEIREEGERTGFELIGFDGRRVLFAHVHSVSHHRVGQYGVDLQAFDAYLETTSLDQAETGLVVIDEIGRMECLSTRFRSLVTKLLDGPIPVVATVALRGDRFIEEVKVRHDVEMVVVTRENRDALLPQVRRSLAHLIEGQKP